MNRVAVGVALAFLCAWGSATHAANIGATGVIRFSGAIVKGSCWSEGAVQQAPEQRNAQVVSVHMGVHCPAASGVVALMQLSVHTQPGSQGAQPLALVADNGEVLDFSQGQTVHQLHGEGNFKQFQFKLQREMADAESERPTLIYAVSYL